MFSTKNMKSRKGAMAGKTIAVAVIIIFIVAAVAGALYLTSSKHPTSSSKTTLTINWSLAGPEGKYMSKTVIPMFEKAYPNITVKYSTLSASTIISSLLSQESAHHVSVNIIEEDNLEMGALKPWAKSREGDLNSCLQMSTIYTAVCHMAALSSRQ